MDYTTIQNAATKIVDNIKSIDGSTNALQNKQDIISTSDMSMANSHNGKLKIEEIGGKCEQFTTTGKNLLNIQIGYSSTKNGVTCTVDNEGVITLNGTASELTIFYAYDALTSKAGKTYKLETIYISGSTSEKVSVANQDANNGWLGYNNDITNSSVVYFYKYDMDLNMVEGRGIYVQKDTVINNLKFKLMFIQTEVDGFDDVYEPYTGGIPAPNPDYPQEIKKVVVSEIKTHGKNCCPTYGHSGSAVVWLSVREKAKNYVAYGTTFAKGSGAVLFEVAGVKDGAITILSSLAYTSTVNIKNIPTNGYDEVIVGCYSNNADNELKESFVYLYDEPTTESFVYEPYTESTIKLSEPIELYGIGDVKDTIEDGKVVRKCGVKVFDGTENLNTQQDVTYFLAQCEDLKNNTKTWFLTGALCNRLVEKTPDSLWGNPDVGFTINTTVWYPIRFRLGKDISSIDLAKAKLKEWYDAGDPMTIVYELAEPITEPLPAVDQIALNSLSTYDTVTYLDFDSEIEPTFQAEYGVTEIGGRVLEDLMTSLNSEILAQSDADRITALESTIVNNI